MDISNSRTYFSCTRGFGRHETVSSALASPIFRKNGRIFYRPLRIPTYEGLGKWSALGLAMTNRGCVALLGDFSDERLDLNSIGRDFSWSVDRASDLARLGEIARSCNVIAVLVKAGTLNRPWAETMRAIRAVAPRARIIVCHKVDQTQYRAEMVDSGAFGVLLSPLADSEVRQSLGFVWASKIPAARRAPATIRRAGAA